MSKRTRQTNIKQVKPWKHVVTAERREAAEARQARRNLLTARQQIEVMDQADIVGKRERTRLLKLIAGEKK